MFYALSKHFLGTKKLRTQTALKRHKPMSGALRNFLLKINQLLNFFELR